MRYVLLAIAMLSLPPQLRASLWDDETLAAEAKGPPDLIRVLTGRFERNPPLYYEARRSNAIAQIEAQPSNLLAYDIAGVACDRLGRGDEAIAWMERKNFQIETMQRSGTRTPEDLRDHFYRCLSNLGTFWLHRWERTGAERERIDEVRTARDMLAKAIALYPHAHLDRDRYQMRTLERIINPPKYTSGRLPPLLDLEDPTNRSVAAVRALARLVVLGNEWESVDLFNTLAQALDYSDPRNAAALLARLRCHELIVAGWQSLVPGAPIEARALARSIDPVAKPAAGRQTTADLAVRDAFRALRKDAEAWQDARTAFMTRRLEEGRQSATDPTFWKGYSEAAPPEIAIPGIPTPGASLREKATGRLRRSVPPLVAGISLLAILAWLALARRPRRARVGA